MNEKIYYNEDFPEGVEPLYNGNIADVYYSAHDSAHFRLSYDGLNRLTASQQYTRDGVKTAAAEAFTYDKMGNITSIELPSSQIAQYFGYQLGIRDLLIAPFSILDRYTRSIPTLYKRLTK